MPRPDEATAGETWKEFWSDTRPIYGSARLAEMHYQRIAHHLRSLLGAYQRPRVLDWGCGDALDAPFLAECCSELLLYDAAEAVRQRLKLRFGDTPGIRVLNEAAWRALGPSQVDVIVLNSVAQYLTRSDLESLIEDFRRVLHPRGEIIFSDIVPSSGGGILRDAIALLISGVRHRFFLAACLGLARNFVSKYRTVRRLAGFTTYDEHDFRALLDRHCLRAERLSENPGLNQHRLAFRARSHETGQYRPMVGEPGDRTCSN